MRYILIVFVSCLITSCKNSGKQPVSENISSVISEEIISYKAIGAIKPPKNFKRVVVEANSFAAWLRNIPLKAEKEVYLYNGVLKPNQKAQFAVIDIPVNNQNLQCADVIMKLRADYLFSAKRYKEIAFMDYAGKWYKWNGEENRDYFNNYMNNVFGWCGSASLERQLKTVSKFSDIKAGDVLVQGGFPGHAVLVADIAKNDVGEKVYMLLQGYQPAQDIHLLRNPIDQTISPWYKIDSSNMVYTPEWHFVKENLKTW